VGWLAAFFLAVTPWSITLSRNGGPAAFIMFLTPLTLWAATWAYRRPSVKRVTLAAATIVLCLLSGPLGWLLAATVLVTGLIRLAQKHELTKLTRPQLLGAVGVIAGLAALAITVITSWQPLHNLPHSIGLVKSLGSLGDSAGRTLLMFNLHGDESFNHNFASQPLLNAFVGLMFVAGVLVSATRWPSRRYRLMLILTVVLLLPTVLSTVGAPNAARAVIAMPFVMVLAAIGTSYMLELWYMTFPINSAARGTGQSVMILLLILTLLQGYTQYFRAWAVSAETYLAYNEAATKAARYLHSHAFTGQRTVIATADELTVIKYLSQDGSNYQPLEPKQLEALPVAPGAHQFIITAAARDDAAKTLSLKFPGGKLRPELSTFSQNEIYYTYEITK
jgi:hypothetical protein